MNIIDVGVAELKVTHNPHILVSHSLGSCVGVTLYDPLLKIGGLAHIMLPDSSQIKRPGKPAKFADEAIERMLGEMIEMGAKERRIIAKIAGGACMFSINGNGTMGERNVGAIKEKLKEKKIRLVAEDTGGTHGRSLAFDLASGTLIVKTADGNKKEL
jgi:chemotaxis protein CheD